MPNGNPKAEMLRRLDEFKPMRKKTVTTLEGLYFLNFRIIDGKRVLHFSGQVDSCVGDGCYLVHLQNALTGELDCFLLASLSRMLSEDFGDRAESWVFYDDEETWIRFHEQAIRELDRSIRENA